MFVEIWLLFVLMLSMLMLIDEVLIDMLVEIWLLLVLMPVLADVDKAAILALLVLTAVLSDVERSVILEAFVLMDNTFFAMLLALALSADEVTIPVVSKFRIFYVTDKFKNSNFPALYELFEIFLALTEIFEEFSAIAVESTAFVCPLSIASPFSSARKAR